ncbi:MAG: alpha/beta hydrolase [Asticcacaulis sp.]|nr:alpha/beta hydrolase [Asticcacaulis sp.]
MPAKQITRRHLISAGLTGTFLLNGCSRVGKRVDENAVRNAAAMPVDDLLITRDIAYASGERHALDIYAPRAAGKARPVVVFIYGGTWLSGAKADYAWVGIALARQGYVAVVADYRIYPNGAWPGFIEDNAAAVRWAFDHAAEFGGDPAQLVLLGHSAGALNAASLAIDHRWLSAKGMDPKRDLKAMIGLAGPYEFVPDTPELRTMFGPKSQWSDIYPITHVDGQSPPILLITGGKDRAVGTVESERLAARLREKGAPVKRLHYPALNHNETVFALAPPKGATSQVMTDITHFISASLPSDA